MQKKRNASDTCLVCFLNTEGRVCWSDRPQWCGQNLKVIPPWSNFFSNQLSFRLSACAYRLCFGTCFSTPGKLTPAVYKLGYCFPRPFFFCLHLYLQLGRGLWALHPLQIFVSLGFAGFSSYRKSIPEVASSHMVLIATPPPPFPFFPADFAGSEAARTSQPGPGQGASGCEGMRKRLKVCIKGSAEEGKSNKSDHTLYHLVSFRSYNLVFRSSNLFISSIVSSAPCSCLLSLPSCLPYLVSIPPNLDMSDSQCVF